MQNIKACVDMYKSEIIVKVFMILQTHQGCETEPVEDIFEL